MNEVQTAMVPDSEYLNTDDVISGPKIIRVTNARGVEMGGKKRIVINFEGDNGRPYLTSKGMLKVIANAWGVEAKRDWPGRSMTLFFDPEVVFGKVKTGGIRVSNLTDIAAPVTLLIQIRRGVKVLWTVNPLEQSPTDIDPVAQAVALESARAAATKGTDAFKEWWITDEGKAARALLRGEMDDLKAACAVADAGQGE